MRTRAPSPSPKVGALKVYTSPELYRMASSTAVLVDEPNAWSLDASPYRRPAALQPLRQLTVMLVSASLALSGQPLPRMGSSFEARETKGRGLGLFALRPLEAGQVVGVYSGVLASLQEFEDAWIQKRTSGAYAVLLDCGKVIDSEPDASQKCAASYINHSLRKENCVFAEGYMPFGLPSVMLVTTKRSIAAGDELLLDYGKASKTALAWPCPPRRHRSIQHPPNTWPSPCSHVCRVPRTTGTTVGWRCRIRGAS